MDVYHGVVQKEWLGLVLFDEADGLRMHQVRHVFSVGQFHLLAIDEIRLGLALFSVAHASSLISALSVVFSAL